MSSEFHKADALQCLEVAKKAVKEGDKTKAQKFALKAQKLCDCAEVREFLRELAKDSPPGPSTKKPSLRQRPSRAQTSRPQDPGTESQRALIAKIKSAKDFYETLDISREASDDDIKRAYKKLALKLHPDKNKAAGAEEAFKSVSRAFSCLSDETKRRHYDRYGSEENSPSQHSRQEFYRDEIDPEELFNMFFGGGFHVHRDHVFTTSFRRTPFRRRQNFNGEGHQSHRSNSSLAGLFSLLPLLLFFVLTFFTGDREQIYSLYKEYPFDQEMMTKEYRVPFYVKSKPRFDRSFPEGTRARDMIERNVELLTERGLQEACREEKRHVKRVRAWRGNDAANKIELKSCLRLRKLFHTPNQRTVEAN